MTTVNLFGLQNVHVLYNYTCSIQQHEQKKVLCTSEIKIDEELISCSNILLS